MDLTAPEGRSFGESHSVLAWSWLLRNVRQSVVTKRVNPFLMIGPR